MLRALFLLLFVMSAVAFGQTEEPPKPRLIDEFDKATNGNVKMRMDYFYNELNNNPPAKGYVINYGTDREIFIREKQIRDAMTWRKYDMSRVTLVRGGFRDTVRSEFWLVPAGAENPVPNPNAKKIDEFEKLPDESTIARIEKFYIAIGENPNVQGYILNFGSPRIIAARESRIKKYISERKLLLSRVTFKNAGSDKAGRTEFWLIPAENKNGVKTKIFIVPPGAKPPVN